MAQSTTSATGSSGGLLSYLNLPKTVSSTVPVSTQVQTSTPVTSGGLVSSANPNAAAINKAHSATLAALSGTGTTPPTPNSAASGKVQGDPLLSGMGAAVTPQQLSQSQGLVPLSGGTGNIAQQYGTPGSPPTTATTIPPGSLGTGEPTDIAANQTASGLLGNLVGQSQSLYSKEQDLNDPFIKQNMDTIANATAQIQALEGGSYSGTAQDYIGRTGQLQNVIQQAQANINAAQQNLGTFSGQAQSALGTGLTAATNYQQAPYGTPLYNPLSGTYTSAGGGTGGLDPASQATQLAQQVLSGTMDYNTALSQVSQFGVAGSSALRNAILAQNPNFNFNLSASSAQTQAVGQQIQTQATATNKALSTLQEKYAALASGSTTGIPGINSLVNAIESQLGSGALSSYKTALADARAQLEGVLTATGATTPTGAADMAMTYLPDNMSPSQLAQNIATVQLLIQQKVGAFTSSGQQTNTTQNASSNLFNW